MRHQEQVTDGENWFGWGIKPVSKAVIGSLQVPYIYEDRISKEDFTNVLKKALKSSKKAYTKMSTGGMKHVADNYSFEQYEQGWIKIIDNIIEKYGSWESREGFKRWHLLEVA